MSWSVNLDASSKEDAHSKIDAASTVPNSVKACLKEAVDSYAHDSKIKIVAYGHLCAHENDKTMASYTVHKA